MKKETIKNKKVTISDLAVMIADGREETNDLARMVARGFDGIDKKIDKEIGEVKKEIAEVKKEIGEVKKDIAEVKENLNATRMDVLGIGDRFVSKHEFSQHLIRFSLLEQKVKKKIMNIFHHSAAFIAKHKKHHHLMLATLALIIASAGVFTSKTRIS